MVMRSIAKFDAIENKSYIKYMIKSRVKTYNKIINIYIIKSRVCANISRKNIVFFSLSVYLSFDIDTE